MVSEAKYLAMESSHSFSITNEIILKHHLLNPFYAGFNTEIEFISKEI